jgi:PAS domain-containing protein
MIIPPFILEYIQIVAAIVATISTILAMSKTARKFISDRYKRWQEYGESKKEMPKILKSINDRLYRVENELKPNGGGSVKDAINIIKAEIDANNWLSPRPTFRCTSKGVNVFVNESYCNLCGSTSDELMKLGWKSFAFDEDQADDYYHRFTQSTENYSQFSGKLKIRNKNNDYRGEWIIRIRPLGPIKTEDGDDFLWHGAFWPADQNAKDYAHNFNIPLI